ncbi:GNAT family N-acetyltransferase [Thalassotalea sp. Y01]|uniref:GNAT family N-acetyltransferase n=1 Tax=Thalassotalea sp. Y01 TaxID=2729613 RepID=UPI00145F15F9|nr:GNAT family N-acetyltransferase [Thalassotalea sp. Y01]NMP16498.1 GNAT family N-acetyltransferase [Thalassotalea sp. Y01]
MQLEAKTVRMRLVNVEDAAFILELRLDSRFNRHLSQVSSNLDEQVDWLKRYKQEEKLEKQYYFIIEKIRCGTPIGTVRLYDLNPKVSSFCWGSWILNSNKTVSAAIESALLVYQFAFEILKFEQSNFDVRKENQVALNFHLKTGAEKISEDDENFYFLFSKQSYIELKESKKRFLVKI